MLCRFDPREEAVDILITVIQEFIDSPELIQKYADLSDGHQVRQVVESMKRVTISG